MLNILYDIHEKQTYLLVEGCLAFKKGKLWFVCCFPVAAFRRYVTLIRLSETHRQINIRFDFNMRNNRTIKFNCKWIIN